MEQINIDRVVDYKTEYSHLVEKPKIQGESLIGLCPFHDDKNASFSVDLKTGRYCCFACGAKGNYIDFMAQTNGISTKDAYKEILRKHGLDADSQKPKKTTYTVADYAAEKGLPQEWLEKRCHLEGGKDKDGTPYVKIPYLNASKKAPIYRKRYCKANGGKRFAWSYGSSGKLMLYGEWALDSVKTAGMAIMPEGESDTQTLWYLGFSALGVPGASTYRPEWTERLKDVPRIYLHIEPDKGGETYLSQMATKLLDGGYSGEVYLIKCSAYGCKDPSELYLKYGKDDAAKRIHALLEHAEKIDLHNLDDTIPEAIKGAPKNLRQPEGWIYSEQGISQIDEKASIPKCVCRTPIILTQRLKSADTGDEKIEIAFKRDGKWQKAIFPRSTIFQARSITVLADLGCTITSENAKLVVKFLGALEQENIDVLDLTESTSTFGWQTRNRFLPGHAPDMVLDIPQNMSRWAAAYCKNGTFDGWLDAMRPHRERFRFRFILAAAFTAPLLKILKQRTFFVYNWGESRGGKTAALKAALSAWGDPERLMVNFNATQVALERMAGFFCDLPLGIDERQLAGQKQESLEKIVYMLANGTGRGRGSKDGGLQELRSWRSVILSTGEEPIGRATSQTGISTRMIEVVGGPFEDEQSASLMHQQCALNCGWAGPAFIQHIFDTGEPVIIDEYQRVFDFVQKGMGTKNGSHVASVAAVATADAMISRALFGESPEQAEAEMEAMVLGIMQNLKENEQPDVNEQAGAFILDWILSNKRNFASDTGNLQRYGITEDDTAFIFPSVLREALEKAGFSYRKTTNWLAESGIAAQDTCGKNTVQKRFDGKICRVLALNTEMLERQNDQQNDQQEEQEQLGFTEVDPGDDLPF